VAGKQLTSESLSNVPGATKRFQAQADQALKIARQCTDVCQVLGTCTKDGRQTLVMQLHDRSLQDLLADTPDTDSLYYLVYNLQFVILCHDSVWYVSLFKCKGEHTSRSAGGCDSCWHY